MSFDNSDLLIQAMQSLGAIRIFCKPLAENDNAKQQIYLGGSFEILKQLPFAEIHSDSGVKRQNFKARLNFYWIDENLQQEQAAGAQLILYPDYPEVRLSGFLRSCSIAPNALLQPVPKELRQHNNAPDGRYLFMGVTVDKKILAYLAPSCTRISADMTRKIQSGEYESTGVLYLISATQNQDSRSILLVRLHDIYQAGWQESVRIDKQGQLIPYKAKNGAGYTLEALLGIKPNANATPDFLGWEVKAYSTSRITLMTPEPDTGYYGQNGAEAFVRKYGRKLPNDVLYFTGTHKLDVPCSKSGQTLKLTGFDSCRGKILTVDGGIQLVDMDNNIAAGWSFKRLITHWSRKHSAAAYVPYVKAITLPPQYKYQSPVLLGQGTDFSLFLAAMVRGEIVFDPGTKVEYSSTKNSIVKARSQFRIALKKLYGLYKKFESVEIS